MKVRISMPNAYMAVEFEEEKALEVFRKLNESMLSLKGKTGKITASELKTGTAVQEERKKSFNAVTADSDIETERIEETPEIDKECFKYRGFLHIKCAECGAVRGFCTKSEISGADCRECGHVTEYTEPLSPVQVKCECGAAYRYMTNIKDDIFDINCLTCGSPVAVRWNEKRQLFDTVR